MTTCYRSTDEGGTWSEVQGLHTERGRAVADPVNPRKFYALAGDRLLVSTDGGASFAPAAVLASAKGSKAVRTVPGREGECGWRCMTAAWPAAATPAPASAC
jgi:hypothetical protein